jgi:hypothetical protein
VLVAVNPAARPRAMGDLVTTWTGRSPVSGGERRYPESGLELDSHFYGQAAELADVFGLGTMAYRPLLLHDLGPLYGVSGLDHEAAC